MKTLYRIGSRYICPVCGNEMQAITLNEFSRPKGLAVSCVAGVCPDHDKKYFVPVEVIVVKEFSDAEQIT